MASLSRRRTGLAGTLLALTLIITPQAAFSSNRPL